MEGFKRLNERVCELGICEAKRMNGRPGYCQVIADLHRFLAMIPRAPRDDFDVGADQIGAITLYDGGVQDGCAQPNAAANELGIVKTQIAKRAGL